MPGTVDVKGFDSTIGYTQWANKPAKQDAPVRTFPLTTSSLPLILLWSKLVASLRAAGAIVICKTNVPQTLLAFESCNPLWDRTLNPWSTAHTAGGSSGGEGALLAMDGAVLGVGTDIGGSIRIPSGYCGIYGFKPGHGRISYGGMAGAFARHRRGVVPFPFVTPRLRTDPNPGFEAIHAVAGPMARSVSDLERMSRVLFGSRDGEDSYFPTPIPYRDVKLPEKLRFGYYLNGACYDARATGAS